MCAFLFSYRKQICVDVYTQTSGVFNYLNKIFKSNQLIAAQHQQKQSTIHLICDSKIMQLVNQGKMYSIALNDFLQLCQISETEIELVIDKIDK